MKSIVAILFAILLHQFAIAQYYYKDVVVTQQLADKWKMYKKNRVRSVKLTSFESGNQPTEGFICEQNVTADFQQITTHTKSTYTPEDFLISNYTSNGLLKKTLDTSDRYQTTTEYTYNADGKISSILNTSSSAADEVKETEQHIWQYDASGKAAGMLKIKNNNDTTYIRFVTDEKGNIVEEHPVRNKINLPVIYYYYDDNNRLTDVVRYNTQAARLLPDYIFEYNNDGVMTSMLTVAESSNNYQKWIYQYFENGLQSKQVCFNKQKQMLGKIEYEYNFK
jgi:YD repeat-containing protein